MMNESESYYARMAFVQEVGIIGHEATRPSRIMRPRVYKDGNKWCALYGGDLMMGVVGFGGTPEEACKDFDAEWNGTTDRKWYAQSVIRSPRKAVAMSRSPEVRCRECNAPMKDGDCTRFATGAPDDMPCHPGEPTPKPANMHAPDGPVCGCGKPSAYQSGLCAECGKPDDGGLREQVRELAVALCKLRAHLPTEQDIRKQRGCVACRDYVDAALKATADKAREAERERLAHEIGLASVQRDGDRWRGMYDALTLVDPEASDEDRAAVMRGPDDFVALAEQGMAEEDAESPLEMLQRLRGEVASVSEIVGWSFGLRDALDVLDKEIKRLGVGPRALRNPHTDEEPIDG
jgi:hypothetical protein